MGLEASDIAEIFADVPSTVVARPALEGEGIELAALMADHGMAASRSEARRLIRGGGVYVNGIRNAEWAGKVSVEDCVGGRFVIVRTGKKRYFVVEAR